MSTVGLTYPRENLDKYIKAVYSFREQEKLPEYKNMEDKVPRIHQMDNKQ